MTSRLAQLFLLALGVLSGAVALAAPGQKYPGESTQAHVWVENRGRTQAIPVVLKEVGQAAPIAVQMTGTPTVQARLIKQTWEYRTIPIASDDDAAAILTRAGADGWEAIGAQVPTPSGTALLLKRPR